MKGHWAIPVLVSILILGVGSSINDAFAVPPIVSSGTINVRDNAAAITINSSETLDVSNTAGSTGMSITDDVTGTTVSLTGGMTPTGTNGTTITILLDEATRVLLVTNLDDTETWSIEFDGVDAVVDISGIQADAGSFSVGVPQLDDVAPTTNAGTINVRDNAAAITITSSETLDVNNIASSTGMSITDDVTGTTVSLTGGMTPTGTDGTTITILLDEATRAAVVAALDPTETWSIEFDGVDAVVDISGNQAAVGAEGGIPPQLDDVAPTVSGGSIDVSDDAAAITITSTETLDVSNTAGSTGMSITDDVTGFTVSLTGGMTPTGTDGTTITILLDEATRVLLVTNLNLAETWSIEFDGVDAVVDISGNQAAVGAFSVGAPQLDDVPVGGTFLPIDTTSLLLAGAQSISMWMIPVILAGIVVGVFVIKRRN